MSCVERNYSFFFCVFFLFKCNSFPSSCFLQSSLCSEAKQSWRCHSRNSKDLKRFTVIKGLFFPVLSCGTRMSCGSLSKSKTLERFLGFGVSYVHRMTPNGVETASGPLLSERESDVFFLEPVQGRSPTPTLLLRKVLVERWSEPCD